MTHEGNGRRRALEAVNGKPGSIKSREEINEHRFGELKDERTDRKTSINQVMKQYKKLHRGLRKQSRRKPDIYTKTDSDKIRKISTHSSTK